MTEPIPAREEQRIASEARTWYLAFFERRVGARGRDLADDLAQEAAIGLLRALRATGADSLEALRATIGTRTWFGFLRREYRWKKVWDDTAVEETDAPAPPATQPGAHLHVGDPGERLRFQVLEFYRAHNAKCLGLAELFFGGVDWMDAASRLNLGYAAIRQQWSRCLKLLREVVTRDEDLRDSLWAFWSDSDA